MCKCCKPLKDEKSIHVKMETVREIIEKVKNKETKFLDLSYMELSQFPIEICELGHIEFLYLRGNQIEEIPSNISRLNNLVDLDLSNNNLLTIPEVLFEISSLKLLELDNNNLTSISSKIKKLRNLKKLFLNNNRIEYLPDSIKELSNLDTLLIVGNQLKRLPRGIGKIQPLSKIGVKDNPIESPPIEIVENGTAAIKDYLNELEEEGVDYLYESKLLILGEGGAGKTTLAKKIIDNNYKLCNEESTKGIEVLEWNFPLQIQNSEKNFRVNIWDFGGQEIYHATHQFFLTKRSLYALVADTRKEDTDFNYWLNLIDILSDSSPTLVILNEKQDRQKHINKTKLISEFRNLVSFKKTNLATNRGLENLMSELSFQFKSLPHIGTELPKKWIDIRINLEQDSRPYINLIDYINTCKKHGISEYKKALELGDYFHDLGVFLHFQDNPILFKVIFLKPKWSTQAVYNLIDSEILSENKGRFSKKELPLIWNDEQYYLMHNELLELMKKFELCYNLKETDEYIIPQLLSFNTPDYDWGKFENLSIKYSYLFLPKGIITRLIVKLHRYIDNQDLVWREGFIIERNNTKAEIIEDYAKKEISIRLSGKEKKDFLIIITEYLDQINNSYHKKLVYDKLIPCNCNECKDSPTPFFYKLERLKRRIEKGKSTVECDISYEEIQVKSLIDDVFKVKDDPNDLKMMIAKGKLEEALKILLEKYKDDKDERVNEILLAFNKYNRNKKNSRIGLYKKEDLDLETNNLEYSLLELIDNLKGNI